MEPDATSGSSPPDASSGLMGLLGLGDGEKTSVNGLLKKLHLDRLDAGDILVLLIAALLFTQKEDVDLAIALVLVFLFDFGGNREEPHNT